MKTKKITLLAILIALTCALSLAFVIPVPQTKGFVTLCEAGIYTTALLFGGPSGLIVGAMSGGIIDFISGYPEWALFSIIIHGAQGYVAGSLQRHKTLGLIAASAVMILGYALSTSWMFGIGAGIASLFGNFLQNVFGIVIALPLTELLKKTRKIPSI